MAFKPKQLTKNFGPEDLIALVGDLSEKAIEHSLRLIPSLSNGDVVHDNAAGSGVVTAAIMNSLPSETSISIEATDVNETFLAGCEKLAQSKKWPVNTTAMSAQALTFPDDTFTHLFTNFAFHCLSDDENAANAAATAAARQIYRTVKPGGTAIASIWGFMPHVDALKHAHWRTRGQERPLPALLRDFGEKDFENALTAGGFKDIAWHEKVCFLPITDLKRWAQLCSSYLGTPPTGWDHNDEDKWDEAIADIVEQLESSEGFSKDEKGVTVSRWVACIAIAKK